MKFVAKSILAVAVLVVPAVAQAQTAAISSALPPSARANGMGGAYVAVADDATAAWWNPGALGFLKMREASFTHAKLVPDLADDVYHDFLAYAHPIKGVGVLAASLVYLSYGESEATTMTGMSLGMFRSLEFSPAVSYGFVLPGQVGLGVTFKYTRVDLSPDFPELGLPPGSGAGSTVAADLGMLWKVPVLGERLSIGAALQNLGPNISFVEDDRSDPIYRNFKGGVAVRAYDKEGLGVLLVGDINQLLIRGEIRDTSGVRRRFGKPIWDAGGEVSYKISDILMAGRVGYVQDSDGAISDPTFGIGFGYRALRLDIASIPQAEDKESGSSLDRVTKFTLNARF